MVVTETVLLYVLPVGAFFFGAIPFAYIMGRVWGGIDIRQYGSGNPGASNVFRILGPGPGIIVFIGDGLKGALPIVFANAVLTELSAESRVWFDILLGALAVAGHIWTPMLHFRGGKGVASSIGVFAVVFPLGLLAGALCGFAAIVIHRFFSLGSLVGVSVLPLAYFLLIEQPWHPANLPVLYLVLLAVTLIFVRHRENIKRLLSGQEFGIHKPGDAPRSAV